MQSRIDPSPARTFCRYCNLCSEVPSNKVVGLGSCHLVHRMQGRARVVGSLLGRLRFEPFGPAEEWGQTDVRITLGNVCSGLG